MSYDTSPEAMQRAGQIWFPGDHNRIRWWATEGKCTLVRPSLPPDASTRLGLDEDVFWTCVGCLDHGQGARLFAEWVVGRPDLGIAVTASKLEVALDEYYRRLAEWTPQGWDRTLAETAGADEMEAVRLQFSSRPPTFTVLSETDRTPVADETPEELVAAAETCDNALPMKRSVYYRT